MRIVVLTGAGISAESGLATFRDSDGLWEGRDPMEVATPEAFDADPSLVQRFYDERRRQLTEAHPNAAHLALGRLAEVFAEMPGGDLFLVTQNVDDLHERGGVSHVHHMHGELKSAWCLACGSRSHWEGDLGDHPACPKCAEAALRPDIVWFGEVPYGMDLIEERLAQADLFVSIGTSGAVYPAAGFVHHARARRIETLELNLAESASSTDFHTSRRGPAGELVPAWVDEVLDRL